jgi:hypothetical protein
MIKRYLFPEEKVKLFNERNSEIKTDREIMCRLNMTTQGLVLTIEAVTETDLNTFLNGLKDFGIILE